MGTTAKRHIKPKHKIELGEPGQIDSTYTRRQFLVYYRVMDGTQADEAEAPLANAANMDETFTFGEWERAG